MNNPTPFTTTEDMNLICEQMQAARDSLCNATANITRAVGDGPHANAARALMFNVGELLLQQLTLFRTSTEEAPPATEAQRDAALAAKAARRTK